MPLLLSMSGLWHIEEDSACRRRFHLPSCEPHSLEIMATKYPASDAKDNQVASVASECPWLDGWSQVHRIRNLLLASGVSVRSVSIGSLAPWAPGTTEQAAQVPEILDLCTRQAGPPAGLPKRELQLNLALMAPRCTQLPPLVGLRILAPSAETEIDNEPPPPNGQQLQ